MLDKAYGGFAAGISSQGTAVKAITVIYRPDSTECHYKVNHCVLWHGHLSADTAAYKRLYRILPICPLTHSLNTDAHIHTHALSLLCTRVSIILRTSRFFVFFFISLASNWWDSRGIMAFHHWEELIKMSLLLLWFPYTTLALPWGADNPQITWFLYP